jgi:hypothetical protein
MRFRSTAEVAQGFAREESAEVAEEDEERGGGAELVAQGTGAEVETGNGGVEGGGRDGECHGVNLSLHIVCTVHCRGL